MFLAERYLRRRYWEGFADGLAEVRAEGRAEGRVEGRVERDGEWRAWLSRMQEAEAWGEPFDEPTPAEKEARNRLRTYS